jgi:predicted nucleic acid-binding protein
MKNRFLLDTNIIIYYFNGIVLEGEIDDILRNNFNISIITKIEFLSWQKLYAIIGATALVNGFDIVTNNVKDFSSLDLSIKTVELT